MKELNELSKVEVEFPDNLDAKVMEKVLINKKTFKKKPWIIGGSITLAGALSLAGVGIIIGLTNPAFMPISVIAEPTINYSYVEYDIKKETISEMLGHADYILNHEDYISENSVFAAANHYLAILLLGVTSRDNTDLLNTLGFATYEDLMTTYHGLMDALNYKSELTSLQTISAVLLAEMPYYNKETLERLARDALLYSAETEVKKAAKTAEAIFNQKIGLDMDLSEVLKDIEPEMVVGLNGQRLSDKFSLYQQYSFNQIEINFNGIKKVKGLGKNESHGMYYRGSNYQMFKLPISATDLLFVLPDDGIDINSISLAKIDLVNLKFLPGSYKLPYFDVASLLDTSDMLKDLLHQKMIYTDIAPNVVFDSSFNQSIFEFNRYGVEGKAISGIPGAGESGPEEPSFNFIVDRPFYFISLFQDIPLFSGKILAI